MCVLTRHFRVALCREPEKNLKTSQCRALRKQNNKSKTDQVDEAGPLFCFVWFVFFSKKIEEWCCAVCQKSEIRLGTINRASSIACVVCGVCVCVCVRAG